MRKNLFELCLGVAESFSGGVTIGVGSGAETTEILRSTLFERPIDPVQVFVGFLVIVSGVFIGLDGGKRIVNNTRALISSRK